MRVEYVEEEIWLVVSGKAGTTTSISKGQNVEVTHERPSIID